MVLAVNCAPQEPADGTGHLLQLVEVLVGTCAPTECMPTASNTSWTVTGLPLKVPGRIEPP